MKRPLLTMLLTIGALIAVAAGPEISFAETKHDFGNIREADGKVTCTFTYTNTGDQPLVLTTVSAPCGCTKPEFSPKPLAPGKSEEIKVTLNPKGMSGEFMKTITVRTNVKEGNSKKKLSLRLVGTVIPSK